MLIKKVIIYNEASVVWKSRLSEIIIFNLWYFVLIAFLIIDHLNILRIFGKIILSVYLLLGFHLIDMIRLNKEILNTGLVYDQAARRYVQPENGVPSFSDRVYLDEEKELVIDCGFDFGTKLINDSRLSVSFYLFKYTTNIHNLTINFTPTIARRHNFRSLLG